MGTANISRNCGIRLDCVVSYRKERQTTRKYKKIQTKGKEGKKNRAMEREAMSVETKMIM